MRALFSPPSPTAVAQPEQSKKAKPARSRGGAMAVAAGILLSRLSGFVRDKALAHYLGNSDASGAFRAALRIPNLLQNLLGEGVLSASFIPVYARLLAEGKEEEANRVGRTVATLLIFAASVLMLFGVIFICAVIDILAPGFHGEVCELTIILVRILFPGAVLLVFSAWCLGILNSHRCFFLSYASPVLWNAALVAVALALGARAATRPGQYSLAVWLAWGAVAGSGLQLIAQLPTVYALTRSLVPAFDIRAPGVRTTLHAFGPVLLGRGSVQLSSYLDQLLASYLGPAMVSAMAYAQTLFLLSVSLFGMSISAAELPEMSSASGTQEERAAHLQKRFTSGLRQVIFFIAPSAVAFVTIGPTIIAAIYQGGAFRAHDTIEVWLILCGSAIGITAGTQGRLFSSAFYALHDTKTPLYWALIRVSITFVTGWAIALPLRARYGYDAVWGAAGLTGSAGCSAWVEFMLLKRSLGKRIGVIHVPGRVFIQAFAAAMVAGAVGFGLQHLLADANRWLRAAAVIPAFCLVYLGLTLAMKVPEASSLVARVRKQLGR